MLIDAFAIKRALQSDIEQIGNAMLVGVPDWDTYNRLVGQAKACLTMLNNIKAAEERAGQTTEGEPGNV